jgi:HAD superfamily hydrolase (TIGR01509 family)
MPPELIIFDCDGVLIDSEMVTSRVIAGALAALGWALTPEESMHLFLGMSIVDMEPVIEARIGGKLPEGWRDGIARTLVTVLGEEAALIPGAREVLERMNALGIDWRIASNSSDEEMAVKFARTGLADLVAGRYFAASRWGRPKPAPDVFLAAAASARVAPARCVVVEDSALGVAGAVTAGMVCYGFAPHGDGVSLLAAGALGLLRNWDDLFGVLG